MSNDNDKDQEYQKNMGKRLRKIRKENALSQDDVADALGICTKQYQSINTQWMLNRINDVLVLAKWNPQLSNQISDYRNRCAIIESNERLSTERVPKFKISTETVPKFKISKKRHHFEKYRRKHTPKFKISKKTYTILKNIEKSGVKISCGGR
ncbi:MAG: helix-turn-helix domain-containing protein [Roseburia sp.]